VMERLARKLLSEGRLVKVHLEDTNITFYVAYSAHFDRAYLLVPPVFCSCASFYFNVFTRRLAKECVHLMAQRMAPPDGLREERMSLEQFKNRVLPLIFKGLLH